jgi:hypothetical protein
MKNILKFTSILSLIFASFNALALEGNTSTGSFQYAQSSENWDNFAWNWSGYDDQKILVSFDIPYSTNGSMMFRMSYPKRGESFVTMLGILSQSSTTGTTFTGILPRTNMPPVRNYSAEFVYEENDSYKSVAKGEVGVHWSLFQGTNAASWTNIVVTYNLTNNIAITESDPVFTNWLGTNAVFSIWSLRLGGTTNVLTDDGTNLLRNGVLIAGSGGSGSGFPATNHMNAAGYNLTNAGTVQASAFQGGTFSGTTIAGTTFSGQNMTLSGNLTVNSNVTYNTVINESTTVYLGTNYITNTSVTHVYSTNYVYLYIYTNEVNYITNYTEYQTYVNVGGWFDAFLADWVRLPHMTDSGGVVRFTGDVNFYGASSVSGLVAGSTITNVGYGLTTNDGPLAIDPDVVATGTPLYAYTETDPVFTNWLAEGGSALTTNEVDPKVLTSLEGHTGDYYVAKWGSDANAGTSWAAPKLTIQAAITNTASSNIIVVAQGVYSSIDFQAYTCSVVGVSDVEIVSSSDAFAIQGTNYASRIINATVRGTNGISGSIVSNCVVIGATTNAGSGVYLSKVYNSDVSRFYNLSVLSWGYNSKYHDGKRAVYHAAISGIKKYYDCEFYDCAMAGNYGAIEGNGNTDYPEFNSCVCRRLSGSSYATYYGAFYNCTFIACAGREQSCLNGGAQNFVGNTMIGCTGVYSIVQYGAGYPNNNVLINCAARSPYYSTVSDSVCIGFQDTDGTTYDGNYIIGNSILSGDLTQRSTDRHYFGTDYIGANTNTGLTVSTNVTATSFTVGYVPIRSDGTNYFVAPFGTNLYFQVSTNAPVY